MPQPTLTPPNPRCSIFAQDYIAKQTAIGFYDVNPHGPNGLPVRMLVGRRHTADIIWAEVVYA